VQLDSFTWHGSPLLPSALVQEVMGVSRTALADRYALVLMLISRLTCPDAYQSSDLLTS
jgi:hypothetical protein